jgi:hypothetical protein
VASRQLRYHYLHLGRDRYPAPIALAVSPAHGSVQLVDATLPGGQLLADLSPEQARQLAGFLLDTADEQDPAPPTSPATDSTVVLELHPSSVPAAELPLVLVHDVARALRAHGLDPDLLALSSALYRVVEATPAEDGGLRRRQREAADEREEVRRG